MSNQAVFSTWPKNQDKNSNILRTKRAFKVKLKAFFTIGGWEFDFKDFQGRYSRCIITQLKKSLQIFCLIRELKLSYSFNCVMVLNILTEGCFPSEIKPFRRSHMILSFLRSLFFRENKLFFIVCKQSSFRSDW